MIEKVTPCLDSSYVPVQYRCSYARVLEAGILENISLQKAFLRSSPSRLHPLDSIILVILLGQRKRAIKAVVTECCPNGYNVSFQYAGRKDIQIIDDLIYFTKNATEKRKNLLYSIFEQAC